MFFFAFIFGAIIGSFLNVVIWRLPRGESLGGRSHCPHCQRQLTWTDLVPVVSFIFLRRKCKTCKSLISWRYPIIELVVACGFAFGAWFMPVHSSADMFPLALWFLLWAIGVGTFLIDFEHFLILDAVTFTGTVLVLVLSLVWDLTAEGSLFSAQSHVVRALFGAVVGAAPLYLLWFVSSGRWLGFGDVKFMLFLGAVLGWLGVLVSLLFSFWLGAVVAIPLLLFAGKNMKTKLPFGTFLVVGGVLAYLFGQQFLIWYTHLLI